VCGSVVTMALNCALGEGLAVLVLEHLEQPLLADAAHVVAGVALGFVEQAEVDAGLGEDFAVFLVSVLATRIVGGVVADRTRDTRPAPCGHP